MANLPLENPLEILSRLEKCLEARREHINTLEDYYDGKHPLAFATSKFRRTFGNLFSAFSDNWCDLVVDASVERLRVDGFRFGNEEADSDAWRIWQFNNLDADSGVAHTEAVKTGEAYLLVSPGDELPLITVEHPSQMFVAHKPGFRRQRSAALKKWQDDSGFVFATLYLPEAIFKYQSAEVVRGPGKRIDWVERDAPVKNPLGVVPVVPMLNNPTFHGTGTSDIAKVIHLQNMVNKLTTDLLVASEFQAFRQRWATGIEVPNDPDTGEAMTDKFLSAVDRMWVVSDENAKFGEFEASDLSNYVKAIEMAVQHIAAQTRTPPHYLLGQSGSFPSGESLKSVETGLVAKVRRKQVTFGESYEEALRLAFRLLDDETKGNQFDAETIWHDPESKQEGVLIDGLVKLSSIGVPLEYLMEKLGATPVEIERVKAMKAEEDKALDARSGVADIANLFKPPVAQNGNA